MSESTIAYHPLTPYAEAIPEHLRFLCFDQAKVNLLWLVEPRITEGVESLHKNPIAESIDKHMDKTTRSHLLGMPLAFMAYWRTVDTDQMEPLLTGGWPDDHLVTMQRRAEEAQSRLLGRREDGNVTHINFRRQA